MRSFLPVFWLKLYVFFLASKNSEAATSRPISTRPSCPLSFSASEIISRQWISSLIYGAPNPPSSPTLPAAMPNFFFSSFERAAYTSQPIYIASLKELAPVGRIMNSCISRSFPACAPPLIMFSEGTGITNLSVRLPASSARYAYRATFFASAPARAKASETARIAFAPSFYLHQPHSF